jgi:hypothetical protein
MNTDLIILLVGIGILLCVGGMWLWHYLFRKASELKRVETELLAAFESRRDLLPYLIESYRGVIKADSPLIKEIIKERSAAREARGFKSIWGKEQRLEEFVGKFLAENDSNKMLETSISWIEARTDLQKTGEVLHDKLDHRNVLDNYLKEKKKQFPYVLFGWAVKK